MEDIMVNSYISFQVEMSCIATGIMEESLIKMS